MHKYFIIPTVVFFIIIALAVFYLQNIYEDWKYRIIGEKKEIIIPEICDDENDIKIISHSTDHITNRSFKDNIDISSEFQFHAVYLLSCEKPDRKFDVNYNIHYSLETINKWFLEKTNNQIISFDKTNKNIIDTTFIRVNKTMSWFNKYNIKQNRGKDASSKIENIILSNSFLFNNFDKKKFIVFFDGWEKRVSLFTEICGRSRYNGKVSIFYTDSKMKKNRSCTIDNINNTIIEEFGESEETILHEILHTLGMPPKCANNLDSENAFHVKDSNDDIMNKVSGSLYLDINNDDYYKHNIPNCPDLYESEFLIN